MRVEVTFEDIRDGLPCDSASCPIARALGRMGKVADVHDSYVMIDGNRLELPREAKDFVAHFDDEAEGEPFVFEL